MSGGEKEEEELHYNWFFKTVTAKPVQEEEENQKHKLSNVSGRTIEVCMQGTVLVPSLSQVQRTEPVLLPDFPRSQSYRQVLSLGGLWAKHNPREVGLEAERQ